MKSFVKLDNEIIEDLRGIVFDEASKARELLNYVVPSDQQYKKTSKFLFFSFTKVDSDRWVSDHKSDYTYAIYIDDRLYGVGLNKRGKLLRELKRLLSTDGEYNVSAEIADLISDLLELSK